jgi:Galactoside-binding lectin
MTDSSKREFLWIKIAALNLTNSFRLIDSEAETYGGFPFEFKKIFRIALGFDSIGVRLSVNGNFFCEYPYKARLSTFSGLKIREKNDLTLHIMELQHFKIDPRLQHLDTFSRL